MFPSHLETDHSDWPDYNFICLSAFCWMYTSVKPTDCGNWRPQSVNSDMLWKKCNHKKAPCSYLRLLRLRLKWQRGSKIWENTIFSMICFIILLKKESQERRAVQSASLCCSPDSRQRRNSRNVTMDAKPQQYMWDLLSWNQMRWC